MVESEEIKKECHDCNVTTAYAKGILSSEDEQAILIEVWPHIMKLINFCEHETKGEFAHSMPYITFPEAVDLVIEMVKMNFQRETMKMLEKEMEKEENFVAQDLVNEIKNEAMKGENQDDK